MSKKKEHEPRKTPERGDGKQEKKHEKKYEEKKKHEPKKKNAKIKTVLHEYAEGTLHSGSKKGPKVVSKAQALAIALSEQRKADKKRK